MRILVTGGTGFLGKHVIEAINKSSLCTQNVWSPSSQELNLNDAEEAWKSIRSFSPDIILHMAAKCGGILANKNSPADYLHANLDMASNIFHISKDCGCKTIYTLGSVCAYPKFCPAPFKEDDLWNGYPEETNAPYGTAKRLLLMLGQAYRKQYNFKGAHLIPVNMYGEYDKFDLTNSHVIPALIRKFDNAIVNKLSHVECWGTGEATREFLYAGDAAEAIVAAIEQKLDTDLPINLGTGKEISIKDLANLIGNLMNFHGEIVFTGDVSDGQPRRMLDVSRAREMLGWVAKTEFREGLRKTIEWYRANKQKIIAEDAS